jgi:peptidoglycan/xylan/chitin deacetylase (PgdA/CDA1 family)
MMVFIIIGLLTIGIIALVFIWPDRAIRFFQYMTRRVIWKVNTSEPLVSLTIDDGPDPIYTPQVLDILRASHTTATFFLVGERVQQYPALVWRMCEEGHEIANHSTSWRRTIRLPLDDFAKDLQTAQQTIAAFPCAVKLFRPAGIWIRPSQVRKLTELGYRCVLGSAYGYDPMRPRASYIAWLINRALRPGAIVVIHDSGGDRSATLAALPSIVKAGQSRRLQFVLLSKLLAEK